MKVKLEKQKGKKGKVIIRVEKTIDDIILGTVPEEDKFMVALIDEVTKRHRGECKSPDRNEAVLTLVNPEDEKKALEPKEEFVQENINVIKQETGKIAKIYAQDSALGKQPATGAYISGGGNLSGDYLSKGITNPQNMYSKGQAMTLNCNCCGEAVKIKPEELKKAGESVKLHEIGKVAGTEYNANAGSVPYMNNTSEQQPYSSGPSRMPTGAYVGENNNEYI